MAALRAAPPGRHAALEQERVSALLHELGDAAGALRAARKARRTLPDLPPDAAAGLELDALVARLYDPTPADTAEVLSRRFRRYARARLDSRRRAAAPVRPPRRARPRIGLLSPQFRASPVYFFGIGALRRLAQAADLVFFDRGTRHDWASAELRGIATDWRPVAGLAAADLERELRAHALDALFDMGGWMDRGALAAIVAKPARRMYKWVGGQALTTGLRSFDGFLGDAWQSPPELQPLYTEPLVSLSPGYVTYTPPPYFPPPRPAEPGAALGVISNPLKLSRAFLEFLSACIRRWQARGHMPRLRFIDRRYRHAALRTRVASALRIEGDTGFLQFAAPSNHPAYLDQVSRLAAVIDTFPYSGGLTTMEALHLGVPCYTRAGRLFCERHTWAHCRASGLADPAFDLAAGANMLAALESPGRPRRSLVVPGTPRVDHDALAQALLALVEGRGPTR